MSVGCIDALKMANQQICGMASTDDVKVIVSDALIVLIDITWLDLKCAICY